tara:strand:+ start:1189 stop:1443 length:255 start_codon:yes stop_codon:yes gene_type:complete
MKELNMSWSEVKATPMVELQGLIRAYDNYNTYHAFDGYSAKEIGEISKSKPEVRQNYAKSQRIKQKYDLILGKKKKVQSLRELI